MCTRITYIIDVCQVVLHGGLGYSVAQRAMYAMMVRHRYECGTRSTSRVAERSTSK